MSFDARVRALRDVLEEQNRRGYDSVMLPCHTQEFLSCINAALALRTMRHIPLVCVDWRGDEPPPAGGASSSGGVGMNGTAVRRVEETAADGVAVA